MSVLTFEQFLKTNESLDTSLLIKRKTKASLNVPQNYYVDVSGKEYRIWILEVTQENEPVQIGFQRQDEYGKWRTLGAFGDINTKDLLSLFGTIKLIIKNSNYECIVFGIDAEREHTKIQKKKMNLYTRLVKKLQQELKYEIVQIEHDHIIVCKEKSFLQKYVNIKTIKMDR